MQLPLVLATVPLVLASIPDTVNDWHPPVYGDFRGPCPMMNTLANHGFLPRDGRNITKANAISALGNGLNFDATLAGIMWEQAIIANPSANASFFTLDHLNRHNVLEHDASLSRTDAYLGNNHAFNQSVFDSSRRYWTGETVDALQLANSKIFRQVESRATNPNYTFSATTEQFSLGEVAAPIVAFGDLDQAAVNRTLVVYFFGESHENNKALFSWILHMVASSAWIITNTFPSVD
ncbi:Chloroperoxidase [Truncatella angustata]|uniref:Chloroperoxidase n=1 Tax=Truncatella angustata TaxID=152316 RepID=A0A9P8UIM3_9PEZI|nr:Chloroperoxidase [Truncatella angustata]KAH6653063.1 Chloroperoxidase [Truncatella angustata]